VDRLVRQGVSVVGELNKEPESTETRIAGTVGRRRGDQNRDYCGWEGFSKGGFRDIECQNSNRKILTFSDWEQGSEDSNPELMMKSTKYWKNEGGRQF